MKFKSSFDSLSKVITLGFSVLVVLISLNNIHTIILSDGNFKIFLLNAGIIFFLLAVLLFCYLWSVQYYLTDQNQLIIKRRIGSKIILFDSISAVTVLTTKDMFGTIRTFGNGGLFGYYGKFYNRTLGSITLYTTQRKNRILIRTKGGDKIIISPDDLLLADKLRLPL